MFTIYFIESLTGLLILFFILMLATGILGGVMLGTREDIEFDNEEEEKTYNKNIKKLFTASLVCLILWCVTPGTTRAYRIWAIGSTIEYVTNNPQAKNLPDKVIDRLDKWLDKEDLIDRDNNIIKDAVDDVNKVKNNKKGINININKED